MVITDMPRLIEPTSFGESICAAGQDLRTRIESILNREGAVLLRGFGVSEIAEFQRFAQSFGHPLLNYDFASTPRSVVSGGVYSSTEYPAHQHIPLHNEQSYALDWPMKIWFHCVLPAAEGGETPIADSRTIFRRIPAPIRERFNDGLLYIRNYGDFDLPWERVFNTNDRASVEAYCAANAIRWQWNADGGLKTMQCCQGLAVHPVTGDMLWFNQAHLFHISNQDADVRETLEDLFAPDELPRNVFFADGSTIEDSILNDVRAIYEEEQIVFPWQAGDVLMLDNMLMAHGRTPFKGPRKIIVAMAEPSGARSTLRKNVG